MTRSDLNFDMIEVGHSIPPLESPRISRLTLALFAGASGDHNPIHVDLDFAKKAGLDDVFVHGMLSMAYLGRMLTNWVAQTHLRQFNVRFKSIAHVHDKIICSGTVVEKFERNGEKQVRLELKASNEDGDVKLMGEAIVVFP